MRTAATFALSACLTLTIAPTFAHARGGDPGTTTPPASSEPCATITLPKPSDSLNTAGKTSAAMKLSATLHSCAGTDQSLGIVVSDSAYQNWGGADCTIPTFTAGPFSLRAGETRTFTFQTPEPPALICTHMFTETLTTSTGLVLGTAVQRFDTVSRI